MHYDKMHIFDLLVLIDCGVVCVGVTTSTASVMGTMRLALRIFI
jgi:hypothetical protein